MPIRAAKTKPSDQNLIQELSPFYFKNNLSRQIKLIYQLFTTGLTFFYLYFAIGLTHLTDCDKIRIDMAINPFLLLKRKSKKSLSDYKQEALIKQGREQFKKLIERGTDLPVVLL